MPATPAIIAAVQHLMLQGTRWAAHGDDPATGCSCYGFAKYTYGLAGIDLPTTAEDAEGLFAIVPPPYRPWDILLCNFAPWHGPRHLALLLAPPLGYHCSRATNGIARFRATDGPWPRVVSHGLRYKEWLCI